MLTAGLAAISLASAPVRAEGLAPLASLSVVDRETGAALPLWRRDGRLFIAGEPGRRYALRVANRTGGRVLLVLSVDGVNVLTGETAAYDQRGYVLDPFESYDVNGWRKSTSEVAAFTFAALSGSYAARTGRPGDVGVIGMAVFRERGASRPPMVEQAPLRRLPRRRRALAPPPMGLPPPPPLPLPPIPAPVPPVGGPSALGRSRPVHGPNGRRRRGRGGAQA